MIAVVHLVHVVLEIAEVNCELPGGGACRDAPRCTWQRCRNAVAGCTDAEAAGAEVLAVAGAEVQGHR
jgi:hypothetical protein